MSYTQSTGGMSSPFATSTTYTVTGASTYSQNWISTSYSLGWIATISGTAIGVNACQGDLARYYWNSANNFPQSGHSFYTTFQAYVAGCDECIDAGSTFKLANVSGLDTTTGRTNFLRLGF